MLRNLQIREPGREQWKPAMPGEDQHLEATRAIRDERMAEADDGLDPNVLCQLLLTPKR